ncbi:hypothetical protein ACIBG6_05090 [Streptomyces sp. NPDC050842]|uniref:hypothetical protein n=1 Tax=Streptomyces sp. NPDC050842 TaxID=3365636 RepID=UPI0037975210
MLKNYLWQGREEVAPSAHYSRFGNLSHTAQSLRVKAASANWPQTEKMPRAVLPWCGMMLHG